MSAPVMDDIDRKIIEETQEGLPIVPNPYAEVAARVGIEPSDLMARMEKMLETGIIRRIGSVPNHYALGYTANGMTVWNVDDDKISELGPKVAALDFVSHCYQRPRHLPDWPYNLFAMVHGRSRDVTEQQAAQIKDLLGEACQENDILYSSRILKKTGLRIARS